MSVLHLANLQVYIKTLTVVGRQHRVESTLLQSSNSTMWCTGCNAMMYPKAGPSLFTIALAPKLHAFVP